MIVQLKSLIACEIIRLANCIIWLVRHLFWPLGCPDNVRSICIHRIGTIGDTLCVVPVIYSIHKKYPEAKITILTSTGSISNFGLSKISSALPWINHIYDYTEKDKISIATKALILKRLRISHFDLWVALPQSSTNITRELRDMFFARMAGVKWAFGFNIRTTTIFKHEQAKSRNFKNEAEFLQALVHKAGIAVNNSDETCLQIPANLFFNSHSRLNHIIQARMPILAIAPGAKRSTNRWAVERFSEVARRWADRLGYVVVVGSTSDEAFGKQIASMNCNQILNLCGQTNLIETMSLLKQCTVALTNDSGPMHMAVAMKLPLVVAFSARDFPGLWHPTASKNTAVIRKKVECSPCLAEECFNGNLCLDSISVEEVWEKIEKYFLQHKYLGQKS